MNRPLLAVPLALLAACASRPVEEVRAEEATVLREGADAALKAEDFSRAIDLYTQSLELNPSAADTWYRRGNALVRRPVDRDAPNRRRDWIRQAEQDYSAAIRLNPVFTKALYNRAMVYMKMKRFIEAAKDLLEVTRLDPNDPLPELFLGEIYITKLEDQQVLGMEHYDRYVKLGGDRADVVKLVRDWREVKRSMTPAADGPPGPTKEEEAAAHQLHLKVLQLVPKGEDARPEVAKLLEELIGKYGHTKYVRDNQQGLKALLNAFRPKEPEKK